LVQDQYRKVSHRVFLSRSVMSVLASF
jgi:hypothetical protein